MHCGEPQGQSCLPLILSEANLQQQLVIYLFLSIFTGNI